MRIISGTARGRKLIPPADDRIIRPTTDRAREALFSIIGSKVRNSRVIDLFAGTGAVGCEALSRGAQTVCFVENNRSAIDLIKKNVSLIPKGPGRSTIIKYNLNKGIPATALLSLSQPLPYDLIFADPPYQKGFSVKVLHFLDSSSILSKQVLVIIEEKKNIKLPPDLTTLKQFDVRNYGDSNFHFYSL